MRRNVSYNFLVVKSATTNQNSVFNHVVGFEFVWFTDGMGWISARNNLKETFDRMDNIYNIADMKAGIMKEIFK